MTAFSQLKQQLAKVEKYKQNVSKNQHAQLPVIERNGSGLEVFFPASGRRYVPENTSICYQNNDKRTRIIMGPIGSGKSVTSCMEMYIKSKQQEPATDGIRYTRWAVVRNTYAELKSTTVKTWMDWFGDYGEITFDAPIRYKMKSSDMDMEVLFLSLDKPKDAKKLLSLELTGVWFNECRELALSLTEDARGRLGRYPSKAMGELTWSGMIMDTNMPDDDHWLFRKSEIEKPDSWAFFKQPPALIQKAPRVYENNPDAENIGNLHDGYNYYRQLISGGSESWIKVYVLSEYGMIGVDRPVYPEYSDRSHCVDKLDVLNGLRLIVGLDLGLTPSAVICQIDMQGKFLVHDELVSENMGITRFTHDVLLPYMRNHHAQNRYTVCVDPAGNQRAQTDERTCIGVLQQAGLEVEPAPTNALMPRLEAVKHYLNKMVAGKPAFAMHNRCKRLRKGFMGGYNFERVQVSGKEIYKDMPSKNNHSHIADALQYAALFAQGGRDDNMSSLPQVSDYSSQNWY